MATKETTQVVVKDIEALKIEKANVILKKENINSETSLLLDNIQRTRSRVVQSPERIKRNITSMGATAIDDKKTLAMHEAKARDLQAKITLLTNIEKVPPPLLICSSTYFHPLGRT
jgi:kinetochore protein Nuf2